MKEILCPNCNAVVQQVPGKRLKRFCNSTCRSNKWQKNHRSITTKKQKRRRLVIKESTPDPSLANNANIDKIKEYMKEEVKTKLLAPKTLQDIKDMCPPELTGLQRSLFISCERQKYGI